MKNQIHNSHSQRHAVAVERKHLFVRHTTKILSHRYERRKIREQLRHVDWSAADAD